MYPDPNGTKLVFVDDSKAAHFYNPISNGIFSVKDFSRKLKSQNTFGKTWREGGKEGRKEERKLGGKGRREQAGASSFFSQTLKLCSVNSRGYLGD